MTALNVGSQVPSNINVLERIALWALLILHTLNSAKTFQLADNQPLQPVIQLSHYNDAAGNRRISFVVHFQVDPGYDSDKSKKLWEWVIEFATAVIPSGYTSN